jgi:hypothetical protein
MPTTCGTGKNDIKDAMPRVAKFIDNKGVGYPPVLKGQDKVCQYVELLAREEHNIKWYTPEELKVLGSLPGDLNKQVKNALKA